MSGEPSTMGNNRIRDTRYLNQYSRQEAVLERFFFALGPKIIFQQHRSKADVAAPVCDVSSSPEIRHHLRGYGIHYPGSAVVQDNENHLPRAPTDS
jgi:hypothetical protein